MRIEITGQVPAQKMKNLCYHVYMMGIYGIYRGSELLYIGQSVNMPKREKFHVWQLKRGIHPNSYLQRIHDKHGDLVFKNIENIDDRDSLTSREIHHIKELQPRCNSVLPDESDSWIFSIERNLKVSNSNMGKPKTAEHRSNISLARIGAKNPMYGKPAHNQVLIEYGGISKNITQWADTIGITRKALEGRFKRGWSIKESLTVGKRQCR